MTTIIITAKTRAADIHDIVGQNLGAICDLIHDGAIGAHEVELAQDGTGNDKIDVMFFPAIGRAAIDNNGGTHWTDATSIDDAIRRYTDGDMVN